MRRQMMGICSMYAMGHSFFIPCKRWMKKLPALAAGGTEGWPGRLEKAAGAERRLA